MVKLDTGCFLLNCGYLGGYVVDRLSPLTGFMAPCLVMEGRGGGGGGQWPLYSIQ